MTYADVNNEHKRDVIFDRRRLYSFADLRSKKLLCGSVTQLDSRLWREQIPVLVGFPICENDIWILSHHCPSRKVHELECANVVGLYKSMIVRESIGSGRVGNWWAIKGT